MESQSIEYKKTWRDEYLKWICAFANTEGGKLYIGIDDNGNVCGIEDAHKLSEDIPNKIRNSMGLICTVNLLNKNGLDYFEIITEKYPFPVSYHGKYYKRTGSTMQEVSGIELDKMILSVQGRTWDSVPVPHITVDDLENDAIKLFKKKAKESGRLDDAALDVSNTTLIQNLHLTEGKYLTRACMLAFHPDPEMWVTGAYIKVAFFENDADILLYVNNFVDHQGEIVMGVNTESFGGKFIVPDRPYMIADVRFANGADNEFVKKLVPISCLTNKYSL